MEGERDNLVETTEYWFDLRGYQMNELCGVLPVLHMPYHDDYTIDYITLSDEIDFAYVQGAAGVVFALASEYLRLTDEERRKVAKHIVESSANRGSVVISVGAESTFAAVQNARYAEFIGATAMMATPPLCTKAGEDQLLTYYASIIEATSIQLVVQDASSYVGIPMSTSFQAGLFSRFGERVGFKPEAAPVGPVISSLNDRCGGRAALFEGSGGAMLAENFKRGITGTMPGTDLLDAIVALWSALKAGDDAAVYALSPLIGAIQSLGVGLDGYLVIEKHILVKRGTFKNCLVRGPVAFHLDGAAHRELDLLYSLLQERLK